MRLPVHPDAELAFLAALVAIAEVAPPDALNFVEAHRVERDDFAVPAHRDVYRAALEFIRRGAPVELYALEAALAKSEAVAEAGGRLWLATNVFEGKPFQGSADENARLIRDAGLRRRACKSLQEAAGRMLEPELTVEEAIEIGHENFRKLASRNGPFETAQEAVTRTAEAIDASQQGRRELVVPTGIHGLDKAIGGLQATNLTLVGALPGVGKSALLATIAWNIARSGKRVGFFSLEDDGGWLPKRLVSLVSEVPLFLLATRPLTPEQYAAVQAAYQPVHDAMQNMVVYDKCGPTPQEVTGIAAEMILHHGCAALIVDHLGELRLPRTERYDLDLAEALRSLRDIAKRHHVPVVVASHMRRRDGLDVEDAPKLTDFANSAAIERMSRVALGLSKPNESTLRISVLKQTNGRSHFDLTLDLIPTAAMVAPTGRSHLLRAVANED